MQTLNLKQLEAFCAVVERGSFTAAAEALYLAQSTVSGHILALEKDIGVPLLVRSRSSSASFTGKTRISAFCSAAATAPPSTPPYCRAKRTSASSARC